MFYNRRCVSELEEGHDIGSHLKKSYFDSGMPEYEVKLLNRRQI